MRPYATNISRRCIEAMDTACELPVGTAYVSITDPDRRIATVDPPMSPIIRCSFWDVEREMHGMAPVEPEQIQKLAEFILANRGLNFIVHCEAGVSRSAAVVQAILDSFPEYTEKHSERWPNGLVLSMLKRALGNVPIGASEGDILDK